MGPTMYVWVRTAAIIWPKPGFRSSVSKAICEQFSVDPVLICTFLFVMSLLEKKTIAEANAEVSHHLYTLSEYVFFGIGPAFFSHETCFIWFSAVTLCVWMCQFFLFLVDFVHSFTFDFTHYLKANFCFRYMINS